MNAAPLVSFIIPVYNSEQFLAECLDSVCDQTVREIEIICVNDGSSDSSLKILNEYAQNDERIRVFDQPNSGVSVARNRGIDEARGKYICFVDSDDKVELNLCEQTLSAAEKIDADLVFYSLWGNSKKFQNLEKYYFVNASVEERVFGVSKMYGGPCEYLLNRRFLLDNKLRFPVGIRVGEDTYFSYRIWLFAKNFAILPGRLYWYRRNQESALGTLAIHVDKCFDAFKVYENTVPLLRSKPEFEKFRLAFVTHILKGFFAHYRLFNADNRKRWKKQMDAICDDYFLEFIRSDKGLAQRTSYRMLNFYRRFYGTKSQRIIAWFVLIMFKLSDMVRIKKIVKNNAWLEKLYRKFRPLPTWR